MPTQRKNWRTVAGSLAILLALLVAPACAPLCASRMCSQSAPPAASEERCHSATLMPNDVQQIQAALNCSVPELAVSALSAGNKGNILDISRQASSKSSHPAASQKFDSNFIARGNNFSVNPEPLRPPDAFPATSVLRI